MLQWPLLSHSTKGNKEVDSSFFLFWYLILMFCISFYEIGKNNSPNKRESHECEIGKNNSPKAGDDETSLLPFFFCGRGRPVIQYICISTHQ